MASSHLPAGCPCVAVRPARSCPLAAPPDCTPLPGSLKDQEENLIEVKRGHQGKKREDTPDNQRLSQQQPKHNEPHFNHTHSSSVILQHESTGREKVMTTQLSSSTQWRPTLELLHCSWGQKIITFQRSRNHAVALYIYIHPLVFQYQICLLFIPVFSPKKINLYNLNSAQHQHSQKHYQAINNSRTRELPFCF